MSCSSEPWLDPPLPEGNTKCARNTIGAWFVPTLSSSLSRRPSGYCDQQWGFPFQWWATDIFRQCIKICGLLLNMSHVAWSVCLSACVLAHRNELFRNGWTDRDSVCGLTHMLVQGSMYITGRWGRDPPQERGSFGGCPAQWKSMGVSAAVCAAKAIIQSWITTAAADCTAPPLVDVTSHCSPINNPSLRCGLSSKFFDHLWV